MKTMKSPKAAEVDIISENSTGLGVVKIHESVISSIVRRATTAVKGVTRLAGSAFVDNLAEIVGSRKIHDRAISIKIDGAKVEIEVKVNVDYGAHVPTLAENIQSAIMTDVEKITGMKVSRVDVVIQEINHPDDEEVKEENEENEKNEES